MECLPIRLVVDCDQNWKDLLIFDCWLVKTFEPTLANFACFWGQTLIIENGQMLDKQSSYLVTLLLSVFFLPRWYMACFLSLLQVMTEADTIPST